MNETKPVHHDERKMAQKLICLKNITRTSTHINTSLGLSSAAISTAFGIYLFSSKCLDVIRETSMATNNHLYSTNLSKVAQMSKPCLQLLSVLDTESQFGPLGHYTLAEVQC